VKIIIFLSIYLKIYWNNIYIYILILLYKIIENIKKLIWNK